MNNEAMRQQSNMTSSNSIATQQGAKQQHDEAMKQQSNKATKESILLLPK